MSFRPGIDRTIATIVAACGLLQVAWTGPAFAQDGAAPPAASPADEQTDAISQLLDQLGDEQYQVREKATRELFSEGPGIMPRLEARLAGEPDPEIRHRLRYILENIVPPRRAVLLIRAAPETGIEPGSMITHVDSRRVRSQSELRRHLVNSPGGSSLRIHGRRGPRTLGPVVMSELIELSDYVAPRGEVLSRVVRLYATGFVEEAYRALRGLGDPVPEGELSAPLRARIAHTAGDGAAAFELMTGHAENVRATGADWSSPSFLDRRGPGKAPFNLEWVVTTEAGPEFYATGNDPDLRVQRILLPAHRYADALGRTVSSWWRDFRGGLADDEDTNRIAGNQLAVASWMLYGMDLLSECCRLIEPRSAILRYSRRGTNKWIRIETDAWLPFLAGNSSAALDGFYEYALDVLQRPPRPGDTSVLTRNPRVAARVAFFLYQFPDDPRVERALGVVSHHTHPALTDYLDWMLRALKEKNHAAIRRDLQKTLPQLSDDKVLPYAQAVALLEYVQSKPDREVLRTARRRVSHSVGGEERDVWLAILDAMLHLTEDRPNEARQALLPFRERPETTALWHTAGFASNPPASAASHAALRRPALAVPIGRSQGRWLVLSRDRRLMHFDAEASLLTALERPTPTWFPNPLTWPWIGREEASGRVWLYCRRRVIEVQPEADGSPLRLNLRLSDIPAFDRHVGPRFGRFAEAIASVAPRPGENSEFLRSEIKSHGEYVADPDLPEVGMIRALPQAPRVVQVALRGGPHMLIDTHTGRSWTSIWIRDRLELDSPPEFFAQALWEPAADGTPIVMLMSDQGLIRFDVGAERLTRIALPGSNPYPPLIPESAPYVRRDPRYVYCAHLPEDGGKVFRVTLTDGSTEAVDMVNEALPEHYYDVRLRCETRAAIDRSFESMGVPDLESFVTDAVEKMGRWAQEQQKKP